jgi:hypothetical protein
MGFADKLEAKAQEVRASSEKCTTCRALRAMDADDLAEYHEALDAAVAKQPGAYSLAQIGRALGLQPGTFRAHVSERHSEPR